MYRTMASSHPGISQCCSRCSLPYPPGNQRPLNSYQPLPALTFALTTSTLILLDPSHPPEDTHICSPALTTSHVGLKPFHIPDITAKTVARAFISGWIVHFGTPPTISTDRGRQFELELFTHLMQLLVTKRIYTTAYHPIAYELVEHHHRQLKASLKAQPDPTNRTDSWCYLVSVLLSRKTFTALPQSSCMVSHFACLVSSSVHLPQTSTLQLLESTMQQVNAPPVHPHHCSVHISDCWRQCCTLHWFQYLLFWLLCKSRRVYLSLFFPVLAMWLSTLLTIHLSILLVCALRFLYPVVFKHVFFWLLYASAAVGNSVVNFVTVFASYFCGDHTFLLTQYVHACTQVCSWPGLITTEFTDLCNGWWETVSKGSHHNIWNGIISTCSLTTLKSSYWVCARWCREDRNHLFWDSGKCKYMPLISVYKSGFNLCPTCAINVCVYVLAVLQMCVPNIRWVWHVETNCEPSAQMVLLRVCN